MIDYYIGTMGFSYKDWAGTFYPKGLAMRDYLSYYSRIFNAVEIDSTFYGIPSREAVNRWKDRTPKEFKVCVKVPREITHDAGLVNIDNEMIRFVDIVQELDEIITSEDSDFIQSGLKLPSVIRAGRLAVVNGGIFLGKLGQIAHNRLDRVRQNLAKWILGS